MSINPKKIQRFSFNGIKTYVRVIKCYDGDTCTVLFYYKKNIVKLSCRIYGIDTPELRTKDKEEKEKAILAKNHLESLILNKIIYTEFLKYDKYGRPLIKMFIRGKSVSETMIEKGFGKEYFGGKK